MSDVDNNDYSAMTIKIVLVPHGFQVDLFDADDKPCGTECRDYGSDIDPLYGAAAILASVKALGD